MPVVVEVQDAINSIGVGRYQFRLLLMCSASYMGDAMEIMLVSYLSPVVAKLWGLSSTEEATLVAIVFAGELLGAFGWGLVGDRYGRRTCFLLSSLITAVAGAASAASVGFAMLCSLRFLVGFGVAGLAVPFDLLMELLPDEERGRVLNLYQYSWPIGSLFASGAAWLILPRLELEIGWRVFVAACSVPPCIALASYPWVPESPEWLMAKGRRNEVAEVLSQMAAANGAPPPPPAEQLVAEDCADEGASAGSALRLFGPGLRRTTLVLWVIYAAFGFTYYGAIVFFQRVFEAGGDASDEAPPSTCATCAPALDYQDDMIAASSELAGTTLTLLLLGRLGRVCSQVCFSMLAAAAMLTLSWSAAPFWLTVAAAFVARGALIATCNAAWVMTPELYPAACRASGHQFATAANRIAAFGTQYVTAALSMRAVAIVYGSIDFVAALAPLCLPRQTKADLRRTESERVWPRRSSSAAGASRLGSALLSDVHYSSVHAE